MAECGGRITEKLRLLDMLRNIYFELYTSSYTVPSSGSKTATNLNRTINPPPLLALISIGDPLLYRRRRHHEFLRCFLGRDNLLQVSSSNDCEYGCVHDDTRRHSTTLDDPDEMEERAAKGMHNSLSRWDLNPPVPLSLARHCIPVRSS